ncbi:MAG: D-alanyl-D-alanine carboxypeptidase family protein [Polyangiaceae bacterium]
MTPTRRTLAFFSLVLPFAIAVGGCAVTPPDEEVDANEPAEESADAVVSGTVADNVTGSCSTASVKPLSEQIIAEMRCMSPTSLAKIPSRPNLVLGGAVFPYLVKKGRDSLVASLDAHPGTTMTVNSMFRTVAQQYLLYRWYQTGRCGIGLAAKPGNSNHETGLAIDIQESSTWRASLENHGFDWFGSADVPHYDYEAASQKGLDVKAFQRLWNRNHPSDTIDEDGAYGPQTEARLKKSPAAGFAKGASCDPDAAAGGDPAPAPAPDPAPQSCMGFSPTEFQCSADGTSRGICDDADGTVEACTNGCLRVDGGADVCMGTSGSGWSCSGTTGKTKLTTGNYYATNFGCWTDASGVNHSDPGDNCIPQCLSKLQANGDCAGLSGPECERHINWYVADQDRFGCGAHLRVTNPANGKSAIVEVIDGGPACWVENDAGNGIVDLSTRVAMHLFGSEVGWSDKAKIHVVEVDRSIPLGPAQ